MEDEFLGITNAGLVGVHRALRKQCQGTAAQGG